MTEIATIQYPEGESRILLEPDPDVLTAGADLSVFDGNTAGLFENPDPERTIILPPGEVAKQWNSVERIIKRALSISLGRDGLIVGAGGGVVTDVAAFAASIYMRGCRLILVPTTLLGMVDAAAGGKTGIDLGGAKNIAGTFYPAEEVRICPKMLDSLPQSEFVSGMAEVLKHAILAPGGSGGLWDIVENDREALLARKPEILLRMITEAVRVKTDVVSGDFRESGKRADLNFGHTFGHALESATNFTRWSHGEAIGWGMLRALDLGERLGVTDRKWGSKARQLIGAYGLNLLSPQVPPAAVKAAMFADKKKRGGRLRFVLMRGPGEPVLQEVPEEDLDAVLGVEG